MIYSNERFSGHISVHRSAKYSALTNEILVSFAEDRRELFP